MSESEALRFLGEGEKAVAGIDIHLPNKVLDRNVTAATRNHP